MAERSKVDRIRSVAISVAQCTQIAVDAIVQRLIRIGRTVESYLANGDGGQALEAAIAAYRFIGVIDFTLSELVSELFDGIESAGPNRLTTAASIGMPMVIVPGGCDVVRTIHGDRPISLREVDGLAKDIAQKASASRGNVSVVVPMRGWSQTSAFNLEVARTFAESLQLWLSPAVRIHKLEWEITQLELAEFVVDELLRVTLADLFSAPNQWHR
jgi:uncharacterized protein (UPF0261 family)